MGLVKKMNNLILIAIIIVLVIGFHIYKSPSRVGARGESKVARGLNKLDSDRYLVLNDVLINTRNGASQIDHIILSIYGIFVIETKNYKGWIFGNENAEFWTQVIFNSKTKFRNPVKQNWAHIYALKSILNDFPSINYIPIVAFAGSAELKDIKSSVPVIYKEQLTNLIYAKSTSQNLSLDTIDEIKSKILDSSYIEKKSRKHHIQQTIINVADRKRKVENNICPRCGGELKIRNGKHGQFYGCSNFPRCRFTKDV
jgi:hypothetical protein